ncbi:MAG TPA: Rrf2 family transcriptional regulator [Fimbriimonadaceae bacterium]|nr:Rrf2 family transcriptional regulator [Fimbriimonadaceae bacterium]
MKFSAQEEYGLRCLLQIARVGPDGSLSIPEISRLEGLTPPHVAKLLMILRRGGFVQSTRGQAGGYALARPANNIAVGDVLTVLGGRLYDDEFCNKHTGQAAVCAHDLDCSIRSVWQVIQDSVDRVLAELTLEDLARSERTPPRPGLDPLPMAGQGVA